MFSFFNINDILLKKIIMSLVRKFFSKNTLLLMTFLMSFSLLTTALTNNQKINSVQEIQADYSNSDYFIDPSRNIRTDYENINSQNWMSFVSGERTLNTINIPGTHDSAMKEVFTFKGGLIRSDSRAKTQYLYIDEQLNAGVRRLDLRLNSQYKDDDGWHVSIYDLTLAHGKSSTGGTYFAENKNGDHLRLTEVIGYLRDFLTAHPSEAIVISYQSESQEDVYRNEIYRTAFNRFQEFSKQINPSTGKSFVHMQDDKFGVPYTSFPKLKDCRGQILLACDTAIDEPFCPFPGGFTKDFLKEHKIEPKGDYEDDADEKIDYVNDYYGDYPVRTLSRVDESDEILYQVGLNCTDPDPIFGIPTPPLDLADDILDHFFYDGRSDSPFIDNTRRLGWVNFDGVREEVCRPVYMSNFPDCVRGNMRTITVKSGLDTSLYPDQVYTVQLGTKIKLPTNIYHYNQRANNNYFDGYNVNGVFYYANSEITIEDNTEIVTRWTSAPRSSVEIIWQDCDDENLLRKNMSSLRCKIYPSEREIDVLSEEEWFYSIHDEDITNVIPLWERVNITDENPRGVDKYKNYRFEVEERSQGGLILRMIHTPENSMSGKSINLIWEDGDDQLGYRPQEVRFSVYENDQYVYSDIVNASDDKWSKYLNNLTYAKDGIKFTHAVTIEAVNNYEATIDGFNVYMHITLGLLNHVGELVFIDNKSSLRPDFASINLYHNDEYLETKVFTGFPEDDIFSWEFPVEACYLLNTYHTTVNDIENYSIIHTSPSLRHFAVLDSLITPEFVIEKINEIGKVTFTNEFKERLDLARGLYNLLEDEDKSLVDNVAILMAAESTYATMDALYQKALPIINRIDTIAPRNTFRWLDDVQDIKDMYDELIDAAKPYVTNYDKFAVEYDLLEALSSVNIFIEVFLYRNLDDPEDVEGVGTCAYTMKRWTSLMERYEALSDTGKSILADDPEAQAFIFGMKLLLARYDLVIKNYGTDMYPDFLHRFSGPVVGALNYRLDSDLFNPTSSIVLIISIVSCSSLALTALLIIKKRKNRK